MRARPGKGQPKKGGRRPGGRARRGGEGRGEGGGEGGGGGGGRAARAGGIEQEAEDEREGEVDRALDQVGVGADEGSGRPDVEKGKSDRDEAGPPPPAAPAGERPGSPLVGLDAFGKLGRLDVGHAVLALTPGLESSSPRPEGGGHRRRTRLYVEDARRRRTAGCDV